MGGGGWLRKPSDLTFLSCIASWSVYELIMDNNDTKSYFLSCKSLRAVFVKCLFIHMKDSDTYSSILKTSYIRDYSFETISKSVAEKFFNVVAKNLVSDVNSITHSNKKRWTHSCVLVTYLLPFIVIGCHLLHCFILQILMLSN